MSHHGQISNEETTRLMELMQTMYPGDFFKITPETDTWQKRVALWQGQLASRSVTGDDAYNAIMYINANDENPKMPTIAKVAARAELEKKARLNNEGKSERRAETPEEVSYNTVFKPLREKMIVSELSDQEQYLFENSCYMTRKFIRDIIPEEHKTQSQLEELDFVINYIKNMEEKR